MPLPYGYQFAMNIWGRIDHAVKKDCHLKLKHIEDNEHAEEDQHGP